MSNFKQNASILFVAEKIKFLRMLKKQKEKVFFQFEEFSKVKTEKVKYHSFQANY